MMLSPKQRPPCFDALIFDMDGTLTRPTLDFGAIRREIGVPAGDLTVEIAKLPPPRQRKAWAVIEAHETAAMDNQQLQLGSRELIEACRSAGVKVGVVTRNARRSVDSLCRKFDIHLDAVVTREYRFIKPHPGPVLHVLAQWNMDAARALTIGDFIHDIECGRAAGTKTCFFQNPGTPFHGETADYVVHSMAELAQQVFPQPTTPEGET